MAQKIGIIRSPFSFTVSKNALEWQHFNFNVQKNYRVNAISSALFDSDTFWGYFLKYLYERNFA
jgi:hypothetical protein